MNKRTKIKLQLIFVIFVIVKTKIITEFIFVIVVNKITKIKIDLILVIFVIVKTKIITEFIFVIFGYAKTAYINQPRAYLERLILVLGTKISRLAHEPASPVTKNRSASRSQPTI